MVGGAAVEFYGQANYATSDIDIVTVDNLNERNTMESLGFHQHGGRHWEMDDYPVSVEFPPAPLAGDLQRVMQFPLFVNDVRCGNMSIISIEDLIVDRCGNRTVHNRDHSNAIENENSLFDDLDDVIYYLMDSYEDTIDWDYLMEQAKLQSEECYKVAVHFKKYFKNLRGSVSPKNPKRMEIFQSNEYQDYLMEIMNYQGKGTGNRDMFMSLAKDLISEQDFSWSEKKDNFVFDALLKKIRNPYKCQHIMFYSPFCFHLDNYRKAAYVQSFIKKFHWEKKLQALIRRAGGCK